MSRLEQVQREVDKILLAATDMLWRRKFCVHLYGVAQCAALLALKRGQDAELASVAAMLHDISAVEKGNYENHCELSAEKAEGILGRLSIFSEEETALVATAIRNHDFRGEKHSAFDELLKDADILHPYLLDVNKEVTKSACARLARMRVELGL